MEINVKNSRSKLRNNKTLISILSPVFSSFPPLLDNMTPALSLSFGQNSIFASSHGILCHPLALTSRYVVLHVVLHVAESPTQIDTDSIQNTYLSNMCSGQVYDRLNCTVSKSTITTRCTAALHPIKNSRADQRVRIPAYEDDLHFQLKVEAL